MESSFAGSKEAVQKLTVQVVSLSAGYSINAVLSSKIFNKCFIQNFLSTLELAEAQQDRETLVASAAVLRTEGTRTTEARRKEREVAATSIEDLKEQVKY